ncbi:MAG: malate synthase A [Candidatus Neomarinimicrobiota bacterium]
MLEDRENTQKSIDSGIFMSFPSDTSIRDKGWQVVPPPSDVAQRHVEITGPVDRKMIINAMNSGADVFMADFEDSTSPTWENIINGHNNLIDANNRNIELVDEAKGKTYALNPESQTSLFVRPRGLHLLEKNLLMDGSPVSASIFDFAMYVYHNHKSRLDAGLGIYFYIPKLENANESQLWDDMFTLAEDELKIPRSSIRATVLLETISASYEIEEMLYTLREHSLGMNAGRWDYIFSAIKRHRNVDGIIFPDRSQITMTVPFMKAYTELLVESCHKRGAHAIGGMSAFIPNRKDPEITKKAFENVKNDKLREANMGFDGSWVAHPDLVSICKDVFNEHLNGEANQISFVPRYDIEDSMLHNFKIENSSITMEGIHTNIKVGILYMHSWLSGQGAAALFNLMEDAATAEISRSQLWQWLHNSVETENGETINESFMEEAFEKVFSEINDIENIEKARDEFKKLVFDKNFSDFLTLPAYQLIS